MEYLHSLLVFALFEDVMLSCCETAGYVRFALFTSGYGYSPPSATLWLATKLNAATQATRSSVGDALPEMMIN